MKKLDIKFVPMLMRLARKLQPYLNVMLFMVFAAVYVFMIMKINSLSDAPVDENAVLEQVNASPAPRIDSKAVDQLQTLKDNSVNVQTLFEENRSSPFQE